MNPSTGSGWEEEQADDNKVEPMVGIQHEQASVPKKRSRWRSGWYSRQQDEAPLGSVTGWPYRRTIQCLAVGVQNIDRARIDAIF